MNDRKGNTDLKPLVSIVIPAHNAAKHLGPCLEAIAGSTYPSLEIIVVDDGSTDGSGEIACEYGAKVLRLPHPSGPAAARNFGAGKAGGEILFFVDADVLIRPETVKRAVSAFNGNGDLAAVFGSYDDSPADRSFISQYRNLFHHFVHQRSSPDAVTFWAGCGAVRREIFQQSGGFDERLYPNPSIEDIELGRRMKRNGHRILLDKELQVKHLKQWSLGSLLHTDIFRRAVPWSKLILEKQEMIYDLNLKTSDRISAALAGLSVLILPFAVIHPPLVYLILTALLTMVLINFGFYRFLAKRKGILFAILAFPLHFLYYFYSGVIFSMCWFTRLFERKTPSGSGSANPF